MDNYGHIGTNKTGSIFKLEKVLITTVQILLVEEYLRLDSSVAGLIYSMEKLIPVLFSPHSNS